MKRIELIKKLKEFDKIDKNNDLEVEIEGLDQFFCYDIDKVSYEPEDDLITKGFIYISIKKNQ